MSASLIKALVDTGMLELGLFQQGDQMVPLRFRLEMLPSYPDVLADFAEAALPVLRNLSLDRLVCPIDAVPFGTALSLKSGLPLVYSRGKGESPVYDLVGAYDVGHPVGLLLNVFDDAGVVNELIRGAKSVGLNIQHVLALVDLETASTTDVSRGAILTLSGLIDGLRAADLMTPLLADAVLAWQRQAQA